MTDTTDIEALPKMTLDELLIRCTDYDEGSLSMDAGELKMLNQHISLLEAERQRAAGSEEELHKALHREKAAGRKLLAAQEKIAALKGEQVPVAWTSQRSLETKNKIVAFTDDMSALDYGVANGWTDIVELFTAPQNPVVLPVVPHDFVLRTGGKQIHFGVDARTGESLWHTRFDGSGLWCGHWYHRTLQELESECISTLAEIKAAIEAAGGKVAE